MSEKQQTGQDNRRDARSGPQGSKAPILWIVGGVVGLALVVLAVVALSGNPDVSTQTRAEVSTGPAADVATAPNDSAEASAAAYVEMQDFDGNTMTISDLEGQPVVVNFWATWCPACYAEMPAFERVYQANRDSVQFLGINLSEDVETALSIAEETGVTYPLVRDPQGEVFTAFGGYGMPTTVFLDENGAVVEMYTGELTTDELNARIVEYFEN